MTTLIPPWKSEGVVDFVSLVQAVSNGRVPRIPESTDPSLKVFLQQCFTSDPEKRPSAHELLNQEFITVLKIFLERLGFIILC